ncbi:hypothetical protein ABG067_001432 [Albugo candida]
MQAKSVKMLSVLLRGDSILDCLNSNFDMLDYWVADGINVTANMLSASTSERSFAPYVLIRINGNVHRFRIFRESTIYSQTHEEFMHVQWGFQSTIQIYNQRSHCELRTCGLRTVHIISTALYKNEGVLVQLISPK